MKYALSSSVKFSPFLPNAVYCCQSFLEDILDYLWDIPVCILMKMATISNEVISSPKYKILVGMNLTGMVIPSAADIVDTTI